MVTSNFPLLKQIDDGLHRDNIEWNKNAFETLRTSNLPSKTIFHYAIDVGLRRLEQSLYENYWDSTAEALNDLSQYLFDSTINNDSNPYLTEARCQLVFYGSIALIKLNTIRRRSTSEAKLSCATLGCLLVQKRANFEFSPDEEFLSSFKSMRSRFLKTFLILTQWLPTVSSSNFEEIQTNHERYISVFADQLFPLVSLREKINEFIDQKLFVNPANEDEVSSKDFVFIRRFPIFDEKIVQLHHETIRLGLKTLLDQHETNPGQKLIDAIWTICCMIESNQISLEIFGDEIFGEVRSIELIDFEEADGKIQRQDLLVFLILCAQQNINFTTGESPLHPFSLFSSSHLCTQQQKVWWQSATQENWGKLRNSSEFIDHLKTIRLDDDRIQQRAPKAILLNTSQILFQQAAKVLEKRSEVSFALAAEQMARRYFELAQKERNLSDSLNKTSTSTNKTEKLFFFYAQKLTSSVEKNFLELFQKSEKVFDELKTKIETNVEEVPTTVLVKEKTIEQPSAPVVQDLIEEQPSTPVAQDKIDDEPATPVKIDKDQQTQADELSDSLLFATPTANKSRDVDVQTCHRSPSPSPVEETQPVIVNPTLEKIFLHIDHLNKSIETFSSQHKTIEDDIRLIRDRLENVNRVTSQMIFYQ